MKRQWKAAFALICCLMLLMTLFAACTVTPRVTVTYDPNYDGAEKQTQTVDKSTIVIPPALTRDDYELQGWYRDANCTQPIASTGYKVTVDVTFYAKWALIPNGGGDDDGGGINGNDNDNVADMSIHFITSGNLTSGDSIYIKAGDTDILIDAGSSESCAASIQKYVNQYCTDGILEYVIVTHEDKDHISGFTYSLNSGGGIFERFECKTIIDFPLTSKSSGTLNTYIERRDAAVAAGANHYTALECYNNENGAQRVYQLADGITMEILYHKYYETQQSEANNNSVCVLFTQGDKHYLFTGDLEESGEKSLVENNPNLPEVDLFKAGHHGSKNASNTVLLDVIKPKNIVISCVAGDKYDFPQQILIDRIANYTSNVFVTGLRTDDAKYADMNGNVVVSCINGVLEIHGTNNDVLLKDTEWFANNRTMPTAWAN